MNGFGAPLHQQKIFEARFPGPDGLTFTEHRSGVYVITFPDGSTIERQLNNYLLTVDGVYWHPSMLRLTPPVYLVSCAVCRNPLLFGRPGNGLVTSTNAQRCACGRVCCPTHALACCSDGKTRCPACMRRFGVRSFLSSLLFENE